MNLNFMNDLKPTALDLHILQKVEIYNKIKEGHKKTQHLETTSSSYATPCLKIDIMLR